jgi:hypothetical protein
MLHVASIMGNTQIVMMLLQYGADVMALTDVRIPFLSLSLSLSLSPSYCGSHA